MYIYIYIYIYVYTYDCVFIPIPMTGKTLHDFGCVILLHTTLLYSCPAEFYKLPTVHVSSTPMCYEMSWAWEWV